MLHSNLMVIANQKSVLDIHTHTHKRERNPNVPQKIVIKRRNKKLQTQPETVNKTAITTLNVTLSVNGPNAPNQKTEWLNGYKNKETPFKSKNAHKTESEGMEKGIRCKWK